MVGTATDEINKIKEYSCESKEYWQSRKVGKGSHNVLECYGPFPSNSEFKYPTFVPENVIWSRFRLEAKFRLVGFFIEKEDAYSVGVSPDVFYIVFLDPEHKFYLIEKK